jgi:hypothetical protein
MRAALHQISVAAVLLTATAARADEAEIADRELDRPSTTYFAAGAITGANQLRFTGFFLESGHKMTGLLFGRVMGVAGATKADDRPGRGTYREVRAGLEGRSCSPRGIVCGSLGLDVGWHRGTFSTSTDPMFISKPATGEPPTIDNELILDGMVLAPRVTFDGGNRARVRAVFELPTQVGERGTSIGVAVSLALGLAF